MCNERALTQSNELFGIHDNLSCKNNTRVRTSMFSEEHPPKYHCVPFTPCPDSHRTSKQDCGKSRPQHSPQKTVDILETPLMGTTHPFLRDSHRIVCPYISSTPIQRLLEKNTQNLHKITTRLRNIKRTPLHVNPNNDDAHFTQSSSIFFRHAEMAKNQRYIEINLTCIDHFTSPHFSSLTNAYNVKTRETKNPYPFTTQHDMHMLPLRPCA